MAGQLTLLRSPRYWTVTKPVQWRRRSCTAVRHATPQSIRDERAFIRPHFHDRANQEATWQAVVSVSGVDVSSPASLSAVSWRSAGRGELVAVPRISRRLRSYVSSTRVLRYF